ncbi:MAG: hypothetical protein UHK60_01740 [Acutalibacteraceae bacterium]|nr:hypothetical protein [Acutalibacteraceae bacterium]
MSEKTMQIAEMVDMLPEQDQNLAYELIKKLVLAWDSDFTKVTPSERKQINEAENSGYISESEIDWDNLDKINLD